MEVGKPKKNFKIICEDPLEFVYLKRRYRKSIGSWSIYNLHDPWKVWMNTNTLKDQPLPELLKLLMPEIDEIL